MSAPRVEVLIPHRDRVASLARTLESLESQTVAATACVIDNGSTDTTRAMLAERFPGVRVVALERNHGFGAAVNRGAFSSRAELLVLLNNDAVADERFVEALVAARSATGAEMVAGCLRSPDGPVESLGVEVDRALNTYDAGFGLADPARYVGPPPLGPSGGAALYEREAFVRAGGFDEAFFAYLEDVDLALRMRLAGCRCALALDALAWHEHSATLGARSDAKNELLGHSRAYLLWKHGAALTAPQRVQAHLIDAVVYAGKAVIDRNLGALRGRRRAALERRGRVRPPADPRLRELPLLDLGLAESLRRRLVRRR